METNDMIKWVRGNDITLIAYVNELQIGPDGKPVKDASGNIVYITVDLDAYDEWHVDVVRCGIQAARYDVEFSTGDVEGTVVIVIPSTLPCGTYALEFTSKKNGQNIRSDELMMFGIVEHNAETNVTFDIVAGERSLDIDLKVQYVAQAITRGKNAYELWKEQPGHEDKTMQDYIDTVLDLYGITERAIQATEAAEAAAEVIGHPDYVGVDNYVWRWNTTNDEYERTGIYVKGEQGERGPQGPQGAQGVQGIPGSQGPQGATGPQGAQGAQGPKGNDGVGIRSITLYSTTSTGDNIYAITLTNNSTYNFTAPRGPAGKKGADGANGADGLTPYIAPENSHWMIGTTDTGVLAEGQPGAPGQDGHDGVTPRIDTTSKHWYIGTADTGVVAEGVNGTNGQDGRDGTDGVTPHIDQTSKHWIIGTTDTNIVAEGQDGSDGQDGQNGVTPHIDATTKHWMIGDIDTGIVAEGTTPDTSNFLQKSQTAGLVKNDGTIDTSTYLTSHQDITGKEDKIAIDSTAKTASFNASVGNYYFVNIAASGSVTITLATPSDNSHLQNAVFRVTTNSSPVLNFAAASGISIYEADGYKIEADKIYEVNAQWNGVNWDIASVTLKAQS